jgi:DNA-binding NarL/FixJ family response regulator
MPEQFMHERCDDRRYAVTVVAQPFDLGKCGRLAGQRITVVEDHALLAQSLRASLAAEGADVHAVELADVEGIDRAVLDCLRRGPHLVLLDLDLGAAGDGRAMIAPLVAAGSRVVVLTGSSDRARLGECLEAGAIGVVEKTEDLDFLVDQLQRAGAGQPTLSAQHRLDLVNESRRQRAARHRLLARFDALTERESDVLGALLQGRQVEEISRELFVSTATVRTHVRAILQKVEVRSQLAAVARAREAGWEPAECGRGSS